MTEKKLERRMLKERRKALGLSQQELADMVGISRPYYVRLESGEREGKLDLWQKIATALDVPIENIAPLMYK